MDEFDYTMKERSFKTLEPDEMGLMVDLRQLENYKNR
jgi:hypothetical protein